MSKKKIEKHQEILMDKQGNVIVPSERVVLNNGVCAVELSSTQLPLDNLIETSLSILKNDLVQPTNKKTPPTYL